MEGRMVTETASSVARAMGLFWFCVFWRRPVGAEELANHRCTPRHVVERGEAA